MTTVVGLVDVQAYTPTTWQPAEEIAALSGIPAEVLVERFGLRGKHLAADDEHVSVLSARAAAPLLARHGGQPLDVLLYMGSPHRDFPVWSAAPKVQQLLGPAAAGSLAFDIQAVSAGGPVALQVAKGLIAASPAIHQVLLAGGSREHDLLDYSNARSRFMFTFGAGGAAALLRRDHPSNHLLESAGFTDGRFADDVMVPAGGSREPASQASVRAGRHALDVRDPAAMKAQLDPVAAENFVRVARQALDRSGCRPRDVALLCMLHTKRSLYCQVLDGLGLCEAQAVYLADHGHMSALDPLVGLWRAREQGRLNDGDVVVLLAAGTGYTWAASVLRWGRAP